MRGGASDTMMPGVRCGGVMMLTGEGVRGGAGNGALTRLQCPQ